MASVTNIVTRRKTICRLLSYSHVVGSVVSKNGKEGERRQGASPTCVIGLYTQFEKNKTDSIHIYGIREKSTCVGVVGWFDYMAALQRADDHTHLQCAFWTDACIHSPIELFLEHERIEWVQGYSQYQALLPNCKSNEEAVVEETWKCSSHFLEENIKREFVVMIREDAEAESLYSSLVPHAPNISSFLGLISSFNSCSLCVLAQPNTSAVSMSFLCFAVDSDQVKAGLVYNVWSASQKKKRTDRRRDFTWIMMHLRPQPSKTTSLDALSILKSK